MIGCLLLLSWAGALQGSSTTGNEQWAGIKADFPFGAKVGVQLFKRSTRALAATEIGRAYYERVKRLLDDYDTLNDDIRNTSDSPLVRCEYLHR